MVPLDRFSLSEISDEVFARIAGKSFKAGCTVPPSDLRYLEVVHKNLNGNVLSGEMICHARIAEDVLEIFKQLFAASYPVEKVRLIDEYDADDELSMRDNNSSCFNFRVVSFTNRISRHGLGLAVDINPRYNPYIKIVDGKKVIAPANGVDFENRTKNFPYKIEPDDLCCRLFRERNFLWGGDCPLESWRGEKDYQHFFIPEVCD